MSNSHMKIYVCFQFHVHTVPVKWFMPTCVWYTCINIDLTVKMTYQVWSIFVPSYIAGLFYITVILKFGFGLSEVRFLFALNIFFFRSK